MDKRKKGSEEEGGDKQGEAPINIKEKNIIHKNEVIKEKDNDVEEK